MLIPSINPVIHQNILSKKSDKSQRNYPQLKYYFTNYYPLLNLIS